MITAKQLRTIKALESYSDAELDTLASVGRPLRYPPKMHLFEQGSIGTSCFLILTGEVEVLKSTGATTELLGVLKAGSFVGQIALIDHAPRSASVVARSEAIVLAVDRDVFDRLVASQSPLALRFQEQVAIAGIRQLRAATNRLRELVDKKGSKQDLLYMQGALDEWDMPLEGEGGTLELDYGRR